jgi:hypothetical protein
MANRKLRRVSWKMRVGLRGLLARTEVDLRECVVEAPEGVS